MQERLYSNHEITRLQASGAFDNRNYIELCVERFGVQQISNG